jgi:hypothetical protein
MAMLNHVTNATLYTSSVDAHGDSFSSIPPHVVHL